MNGAYVCQIHLIFNFFTNRECTDGYESLPFIEPMMELKIFSMVRSSEVVHRCLL
jgi:hypothetical protein